MLSKNEIKGKVMEVINNLPVNKLETDYSFYTIDQKHDGSPILNLNGISIDLESLTFKFFIRKYVLFIDPNGNRRNPSEATEVTKDVFFERVEKIGGFETAQEAIDYYNESISRNAKNYLLSEIANW